MKIQRHIKGEFGYPAYECKRVIIRTAAYFLISIAVFLLGYFSTGKKENLLTIVAVLGMLPSSKSLVSVIMYVRIPKFDEKIYHEISEITETKANVTVIYSMYLTSYRLNFPINCFAIRGSNLIGYTEFQNCDAAACENHIKDMFKQNGIKNMTVKIFHEKARFTERLVQLKDLEEGKKEAEVIELLCDISL